MSTASAASANKLAIAPSAGKKSPSGLKEPKLDSTSVSLEARLGEGKGSDGMESEEGDGITPIREGETAGIGLHRSKSKGAVAGAVPLPLSLLLREVRVFNKGAASSSRLSNDVPEGDGTVEDEVDVGAASL